MVGCVVGHVVVVELVQTCSDLFKLTQTRPNLSKLTHTRPNLSKLVQTRTNSSSILPPVGEASGKGSRSIAKHVGPSSVDPAALSARAGAATSDIGRAKMLAIERGQKLGELEERTARMMMESESFSSNAQQLMMKYRDKKWYQL